MTRRTLEQELSDELEAKRGLPAPPAAASKVKHRTGAGARFNADHIGIYRAVNIGVLITALAAVLISWQGLVYVAAWMELEGYWRFLLPLAIDVPIVVFTLATLNRKARGEGVLFLAIVAYLMTAISSFANFLHVAEARSLETMPGIVGASLAALAPMLVLLTTEALGLIATKPPAESSPRAKQKRQAERIKELESEARKAAKELRTATQRAADADAARQEAEMNLSNHRETITAGDMSISRPAEPKIIEVPVELSNAEILARAAQIRETLDRAQPPLPHLEPTLSAADIAATAMVGEIVAKQGIPAATAGPSAFAWGASTPGR